MKRIVPVCIIIVCFAFTVSIQAQDNTPEVTPPVETTPDVTPPVENTPEVTPSVEVPSDTPTSTNTATNTPTVTPSNTSTNTPTITATNTGTNTPTVTVTNTSTNTPTITATNTGTNTPTNTPTSTKTNTPTLTPGSGVNAPTDVKTVTNGFQITITWTDTNNGETFYEVERKYESHNQVPANSTSFTETLTGCGLTVWYRVRAIFGTSKGPYSAWVPATTPPCDPVPVCDPSATIQRVTGGAYQTEGLDYNPFNKYSFSDDSRYLILGSTQPLTSDRDHELSVEADDINDVYSTLR